MSAERELPVVATTGDVEKTTCDTCGRDSYSLTNFGWCPWCDSAYKPGPRKRRTLQLPEVGELWL
jgi:hypothetical protein